MKSIVWPMMLAGLLAVSSLGAEEQIPWARDFQSACAQASEQRRLVLLHFYNDNCPPCLRVDQNVFSQTEVAEAVALNYVPVKVHAGKTPQLAARYQVTRWPTDVIVTPVGQELYRAVSPQKPADYITLVNQVAAQTGTSAGRQWKSNLKPAGPAVGTSAAAGFASGGAASADSANKLPLGSQVGGGQAGASNNSAGQFFVAAEQAGASLAAQSSKLRSSFVPGGGAATQESFASAFAPQAAAASAEPPTTSVAPAAGAQPGNAEPSVTTTRPPLPTENPWIGAARAANPPAAAPAVTETPAALAQSPINDQYFAAASTGPSQSPTVPQPPILSQRPSEQPYFAPPAQAAAPNVSSPPTQAVAAAPAQVASERATFVPADQAPPIALGGHCPVTLLEGNAWQKANPLYGAIHEGQTYLFVTPAEQQRFLAEPQRYAFPPLGLDGFCPVTLRDNMKWQKADRQHFATHRGRMYFFASPAARDQFLAAPDAYAPVLSGFDPVRFVQRGEVVEGKRAYGLITGEKQIYLFADQQSLDAFEKNPAEFQERTRQAMTQRQGHTAYR